MKGETIYKILDFLEDVSMDTADFLGAFLSAGYGATPGKIDYKYRKKSEQRFHYQLDRDKRRRLQVYLSKLKGDGLILENSSKEIALSVKGKTKLHLLKKKKILDKHSYKKENGDRVIIISYDLPVPFNKERNILRDILRMLGFNMVHKSVWIGKVKLPEQFIDALGKLEILSFVEILEVTKNGSLKSI